MTRFLSFMFLTFFWLALTTPFAMASPDLPDTPNPNPSPSPSPDEYEAMNKNTYKKLLSGKTLIGEYRRARERSKTYLFEEEHLADGTTNYREGKIKAKGVWYTLGKAKICYRYDDSPQMGNHISCFWIYEARGCYYGYGLNTMTPSGPRNYEAWTARWILKGSGKQCATPIS